MDVEWWPRVKEEMRHLLPKLVTSRNAMIISSDFWKILLSIIEKCSGKPQNSEMDNGEKIRIKEFCSHREDEGIEWAEEFLFVLCMLFAYPHKNYKAIFKRIDDRSSRSMEVAAKRLLKQK